MKIKSLFLSLVLMVAFVLIPTASTQSQDAPEAASARDFAWNPDGTQLAVVGNFGVALYDADFELIKLLTNLHTDLVDWSADGTILATSRQISNATIDLWNMETEQIVQTISVDDGILWNIDLSPNNQQLVATTHDKGIYIFDVTTQALVFSFNDTTDFEDAQWSPDGGYLLAIDRSDSFDLNNSALIYLWDTETHSLIFSIDLNNENIFNVYTFAWQSDSRHVTLGVGASPKGSIPQLDIVTQEISNLFAAPIEPLTFVGWNTDETLFAATDKGVTGSTIYMYSNIELLWFQTLSSSIGSYLGGAWQPNSSWLVVLLRTYPDNVNGVNGVLIFDAITGDEVSVLALPEPTSDD